MAGMKITVKSNGPLVLDGDLTLCDPDGKEYGLAGRKVIGLCRCGHTANKPFCDGSHKSQGFQAEAKAFELPPPKQS